MREFSPSTARQFGHQGSAAPAAPPSFRPVPVEGRPSANLQTGAASPSRASAVSPSRPEPVPSPFTSVAGEGAAGENGGFQNITRGGVERFNA